MQSLNQSAIKYKLGLLNLAAELGNVSKVCKMMGGPHHRPPLDRPEVDGIGYPALIGAGGLDFAENQSRTYTGWISNVTGGQVGVDDCESLAAQDPTARLNGPNGL